MKEGFIQWKPSANSVRLIDVSNRILDEYEQQGYKLTLRQLYYQLVSRDVIPNAVNEYNNLGNVISKGRLAGLIDWSRIEDRMRSPIENQHWDNPAQILRAATNSYYLSKWENQDNYIEVWCEKDAVSNIIQPICSKWDVLFMANRGYSSQSAMYEAYQRIANKTNMVIIYLGDHDPSGIDMTHDISNRLGIFLHGEGFLFDNVRRIALNMDQVEQYNPPNNPAKITDSRYRVYVEKYGESSWELDALEPAVLTEIVEDAIFQYLDIDEFNRVAEIEQAGKNELLEIAKQLSKANREGETK